MADTRPSDLAVKTFETLMGTRGNFGVFNGNLRNVKVGMPSAETGMGATVRLYGYV